jgi:hypothetical protein
VKGGQHLPKHIWDKSEVLCGEHVGEHIGNLKNLMGLHWELERNTMGTREIGKKQGHLECMLGPSHWLHEISLPKRLLSPFLA